MAQTFSPCAAAAAYRREIFFSAGGFDSSFFCRCEDIDRAFHLRLRGHYCAQITDAGVRHIGSASNGQRSAFSIYHGTRNRIWVMAKNMPLPLLVFSVLLHATALILFTQQAAFRRGGKSEIKAMWLGVCMRYSALGRCSKSAVLSSAPPRSPGSPSRAP